MMALPAYENRSIDVIIDSMTFAAGSKFAKLIG